MASASTRRRFFQRLLGGGALVAVRIETAAPVSAATPALLNVGAATCSQCGRHCYGRRADGTDGPIFIASSVIQCIACRLAWLRQPDGTAQSIPFEDYPSYAPVHRP